jgi:hypothetical protein
VVVLCVVVTASFVFWDRVADTVPPMWPSPHHPRRYLILFVFFVIRCVVIKCRFPERLILTVRGEQGPSGRCCLYEGVLVSGMPKWYPGLLALKRWAWTGTARRLAAG